MTCFALPLDVGRWTLSVRRSESVRWRIGRFSFLIFLGSSLTNAQEPASSPNQESEKRTFNVQHSTSNVQQGDQSDSLSLRGLARWDLTFAELPAPSPSPPTQFNPDPGAPNEPESIEPPSLFPPVIPPLPQYGEEALPRSLELPRKDMREVVPDRHKLEYEDYPEAERGRGSAAQLAGGAESLVHRFRTLETLRRPVDRDALPIRRSANSGIHICRAPSKATPQSSARTFFSI